MAGLKVPESDTQPAANPYLQQLEAAPSVAAAPSAPENPYLKLLQSEDEQRSVKMKANLSQAVDVNPDQYAKQKQTAKALGYPVAAVEALPEQSQKQAQMQQVQQSIAAHPVLQDKYSDADFAKLAHDDSGVLSSVGDLMAGTAKFVFSAPDSKYRLSGAVGAGIQQANRGAAGLFQAAAELPAPLLDPLERFPQIGGNPLRRLAEGFAGIGAENKANADRMSPASDNTFIGGVTSGVQSFTQNAMLLPAAFLPGGGPAVLGTMSAMQGGQSYQDARTQGLTPLQALPFAASQAAIEYATEKIPLTKLIGDVKAAAPLLQTLAKQAALEIPGEQVATVLQDLNEWAALPQNKDKPFSSYLAERPNAAAQTLIATVVGVGGNVVLSRGIANAMGQVDQTQAQQQQADTSASAMQELVKQGEASKLRERSPESFAELVQNMADNSETAPKEVRFDARTLAETLQQSGLDDAKLAELLPTVSPQLAEALATGGEVTIPVGDFTKLIGTGLETSLLQHARIGTNELSQAESKEAAKQTEQLVQEQSQRIAEQTGQAVTNQVGADAVKQNLTEQLNTANRFTPEVNATYATAATSFYTATAERLGVTPDELYSRFPLKIQGASVEGESLNDQPRQFEQSGGTPIAQSQVTDAQGQAFNVSISSQTFGYGNTKPNSVFVELRDPQTNERRGFVDFAVAEDGTLTSENTQVAGAFRKRGLSAAMYQAARDAGFDIAPGRVQTEQGQAMVEGLQRKGIINKEKSVLNQDVPVTETKAFKDWFKGSKVVDDQGKPLVVYHGTKSDFSEFDIKKFGASDEGLAGKGFYFTYNPKEASGYALNEQFGRGDAPNVQPVFISLKNPLVITQGVLPDGRTVKDLHGGVGINAKGGQALRKIADEGGHDGVMWTSADNQPRHVLAFQPEQIKSAIGNSGAFNPNDPNILNQGPRGTYSPSTLTISLLENANLSTFVHELGHFFLDTTAAIASQPGAPAQVVEDMNKLLSWFGVADVQTWQSMTLDQQRPYHERLAESFEQYLFEGKAPSTELQPVFQRFRAWLTNVYRSLSSFMQGRGLNLTDEVRGVFDRMLATDEQIAQAQAIRAYEPLFKDAQQAGMDEQQWAAYQAKGQEATNDAIDTMQTRSLRDMRWASNAKNKALKALQKDVADKRKAVEAEVRAEVEKQPVYQAMRWLRKGEMTTAEGEQIKAEKGFRLNTEALAEMYPESGLNNPDLEKLKGMTAANGLHPDMSAAMLGFESGDQMVREIVDAQPMADVVEGMTDQRMLERFGDLATPQGVARAADDAVHNEARGRFIATGLKALMDANNQTERTAAGGSVNVMVRAAKQFAQNLVSNRKIRELRLGQHQQAEARAGKAALKAVAKNDTQGAIVAQRDQLLNHYAARATAEAIDSVEKAVTYLKKFDKESTRKKLPIEYLDQIDKLLERTDLRQITNTASDKRAKLAEWIAKQEDLGKPVELPAYLLEDVQLTSYREMTVESFQGLVDTVKQIEHLGRTKDKLLTAKHEREFAEQRDLLVASVLENSNGRKANPRTATTPLGKTLQAIKRFGAAHIKAATGFRILDGGKDGGQAWETFVRPANERANFQATTNAEATKELSAIMEPWLKKGPVNTKEKYPSLGRSFTRKEIFTMALNTGNEGNLQRLLGGEGWTLEQLRPALDTLGKDDWATVQKVWDSFNKRRDAIDAMERRVYGKPLPKVEPGSALTDGYGVTGGYYPIVYDPAASNKAEENDDAETAKRQLQNAYSAAKVRNGFTKARADEVNNRPLLYDLNGLYRGTNDQIHYLTWTEWLIDANRMLRDKGFDAAVRNTYGEQMMRQFKTWRDAIAEGDSRSNDAIDTASAWLRQSVSVAGLGFNVMSAAMQPLGLTQSITRVGAQWVGKGLIQYVGSPIQLTKTVNEKSEFMANRSRTRFRELNELRNKIERQSKLKQVVANNAYFLMLRLQQMVDVPTWQGAYEKAIADGQNDDRAIDLADQAVIDSQGGGQTKDLSAIERGSSTAKLFTVFYSFMNTALNLGVASKMTPKSKAKFAVDMLMLYTVPAVLGSILKDALTPGGGDDDEEKIARKLAAEQLNYLFSLMVVGREFAEVAKIVTGSGQARDYSGPAGLRAISDAIVFTKQANQGEFDDAFRKAAINLTGDFTGLPSAQINKTITGIKALAEGDTKNPLAVVMGYKKPN